MICMLLQSNASLPGSFLLCFTFQTIQTIPLTLVEDSLFFCELLLKTWLSFLLFSLFSFAPNLCHPWSLYRDGVQSHCSHYHGDVLSRVNAEQACRRPVQKFVRHHQYSERGGARLVSKKAKCTRYVIYCILFLPLNVQSFTTPSLDAGGAFQFISTKPGIN